MDLWDHHLHGQGYHGSGMFGGTRILSRAVCEAGAELEARERMHTVKLGTTSSQGYIIIKCIKFYQNKSFHHDDLMTILFL